MGALPDYLAPGLRVVFCGTAAGKASARVGGYYAGPGNAFWPALYSAGLVPVRLEPGSDHRVLEFGIGLTDLAKKVVASSDRGLGSHYDVGGFLAKMERFSPTWIAFHGKEAGKVVSRYLKHGADVRLGAQDWQLGDSRVFVLPSMSGANRDPSRLEGKPSRKAWFEELAATVDEQA